MHLGIYRSDRYLQSATVTLSGTMGCGQARLRFTFAVINTSGGSSVVDIEEKNECILLTMVEDLW